MRLLTSGETRAMLASDVKANISQVQELVRKLDRVQAEAKSVQELFTGRALQLRSRIRDLCLRIRLQDFADDGRKAEETIWRKVFHSVMQKFKRFPDVPTARATSLMESHFLLAVGFYCNLIHALADRGLDVSIVVNTSSESRVLAMDVCVRTAMRQTVHRCLTYMGDCYRYLDELATASAKNNAIYWYNKAIIWDPTNGMPFNQLATLVFNNNYGLDAVYYYLRCVTSEHPFTGAEVNLKRIIGCRLKEGNQRNNSTHCVRHCIDSLREVSHQILFSSSATSDSLVTAADNFSDALSLAAKLPATIVVPSRPACLDDAIWFKIGLIILMTGLRVTRPDKRKAISYLLRQFFAALINTLTTGVSFFCVQKGGMADKLSESGSGDSDSSPSDDRKSRENTPESSPFRHSVRSHKRRRRRHLNRKDSNPDSDLSELEETALRTIGALDISTDCSGDENSEYESSRSSQEQDCDKTLNLKRGRVAGVEVEVLEVGEESAAWSCLQQLYQHSPIQTCKVLCDVLDANPATLQSCSLDQSQVQALVELLNLCVKVESELMSDSRWNSKFMKRGFEAEWQQRIPLPADWTLLHFPLLAPIHRDMIFSANCKQLSASESCFLCLQRMIAFGVRTARTTNLISFDCQALTFALPPLQKQAVARTPLGKPLRSTPSAKSSDPKDL